MGVSVIDAGQCGSRDKILPAAVGLFARRGCVGTPFDAIAEEAGVNKDLIYCCSDRRKILTTIIEQGIEKVRSVRDELSPVSVARDACGPPGWLHAALSDA